jgi:carbamoyl-phosphate synthase large subunit
VIFREFDVMRTIKLLLTCAGGDTGPSLFNCLKNSDNFNYILVGVDSVSAGKSVDILDAYHQVPNGSDSQYVYKLLEVALKENVDFILPGSDEEALSIARNIVKFKDANVDVIASSINTLELISNKLETYKVLSKNCLRIPEYTIANSAEEIKDSLSKYGYPQKTVISKPSNGRGGRGLCVFQGEDKPPSWLGSGKRESKVDKDGSIDELIKKAVYKDGLVMPALTAPAYDVDVMAIKGNVKAVVVRERLNPAGIPFQGNRVLNNKAIESYCVEVSKALKLDGLHDIDLMTNSDGEPCVIEVNPRYSGSIAASLTAGMPMIDIAILSLLGEKVPKISIESDVTVIMDDSNKMRVVS